jgi:diadenosine tetraphosphate (Ap4A) HIT family hydrolase
MRGRIAIACKNKDLGTQNTQMIHFHFLPHFSKKGWQI